MPFNQAIKTRTNALSTIRQLPLFPLQPIVSRNNKKNRILDSRTLQMTVLVLDNPDLIAKAALASGFAATLTSEPQRPHRMKFHYGFNKHSLDAVDVTIMQQHAAYLRQYPTISLRIHGHSDNFGSEDYNQFLSRLRANAVARLLIQEGVPEAQISLTGWGSTRPLATLDDHAANRRVEMEYLTQDVAQALQG